jgi:hypothetical protein
MAVVKVVGGSAMRRAGFMLLNNTVLSLFSQQPGCPRLMLPDLCGWWAIWSQMLYVLFQWFATEIMGLFITGLDGVVWASKQYGEMTPYMARTIKEVVLA